MNFFHEKLIRTINDLVSVIKEEIPRSRELDLREARRKSRAGDPKDGNLLCALLQADSALCALELAETTGETK